MKVLLVNHAAADKWVGGDSVQIKNTAKGLIERGYEVEIQNSDKPVVDHADIVHIFNCRVQTSFPSQVYTCKDRCKPLVLSPIWVNLGKALWGSRGTVPVLEEALKEGEEKTQVRFEQLRRRKLVVNMENGVLKAHGRGSYNREWHEQIPSLVSQADGVVANSWLEIKAVQADLDWSGNCFGVAHYGVDPKIYLEPDPDIFRQSVGIHEPFILQVGRIEPGKNQAMLCWALRKLGVRVVLVGSSSNWPSYASLCKELGGGNVTVIDHLPPYLIASAYAAAEVHCLVSWMETCGLVSLEAGLAGTPVVASTFGHELEYLKSEAYWADPANPDSIRQAVEMALSEGKNTERTRILKNRVLTEYTWDNTTRKTEEIYNRVLNEIA